jgi:hypothetical protein
LPCVGDKMLFLKKYRNRGENSLMIESSCA